MLISFDERVASVCVVSVVNLWLRVAEPNARGENPTLIYSYSFIKFLNGTHWVRTRLACWIGKIYHSRCHWGRWVLGKRIGVEWDSVHGPIEYIAHSGLSTPFVCRIHYSHLYLCEGHINHSEVVQADLYWHRCLVWFTAQTCCFAAKLRLNKPYTKLARIEMYWDFDSCLIYFFRATRLHVRVFARTNLGHGNVEEFLLVRFIGGIVS